MRWLCRKRTVPGQVGGEHLLLVALLGGVGLAGLGATGRAFDGAIADRASGAHAVVTGAAEPGGSGVATLARAVRGGLTVGSEAALGALARRAEELVGLTRHSDDALVAGLPAELSRYVERSPPLALDALPPRASSPRRAFGQPVEYGFEVESMRLGALLDWYEPHDWLGRMRAQQRDRGQVAALVEDRFRSLRPRGDAPRGLAETVTGEFETVGGRASNVEGRIFELRSEGGLPTERALLELASTVHNRVGGSVQWHVSFVPTPTAAGKVTDLLAHLDEYETLRLFAEDARWVDYRFRGPYREEALRRVERILTEGPKTSHDESKFHSVGFRSGRYGDAARVGFEFRARDADVEGAAALVDATVSALEDLDGAVLRFEPGVPGVRLAERRGIEALGPSTEKRIPADVQRRLQEAHMEGQDVAQGTDVLDRWKLPYIPWEERPWLRVRAAEIAAAREAYGAAVRSVDGGTVRERAARISEALHTWAATLRLHEQY